MLRAIQKGNAPSLIAALAHDTANMYQAAAQAFKQVASTSKLGSKQGRYAEWKLLVFQGYMYAFTGILLRHSNCSMSWCNKISYHDCSACCGMLASAHANLCIAPEHTLCKMPACTIRQCLSASHMAVVQAEQSLLNLWLSPWPQMT